MTVFNCKKYYQLLQLQPYCCVASTWIGKAATVREFKFIFLFPLFCCVFLLLSVLFYVLLFYLKRICWKNKPKSRQVQFYWEHYVFPYIGDIRLYSFTIFFKLQFHSNRYEGSFLCFLSNCDGNELEKKQNLILQRKNHSH